jgi:hypothetical protein
VKIFAIRTAEINSCDWEPLTRSRWEAPGTAKSAPGDHTSCTYATICLETGAVLTSEIRCAGVQSSYAPIPKHTQHPLGAPFCPIALRVFSVWSFGGRSDVLDGERSVESVSSVADPDVATWRVGLWFAAPKFPEKFI